MSFAPALAGGALIGLGASVLLLFNGRVAGISGIFAGLLEPGVPDRAWRLSFVIGLLLAGAGFLAFSPAVFGAPAVSIPAVAVSGLLVGFGTRLGSGCTSGHGVCGLSRLSVRSLVATLTFIGAGVITVLALRTAGVTP